MQTVKAFAEKIRQRSTAVALTWALGIALIVRLLSLGLYPLSDTTEARYAEIARKMFELGDWVTPWYDYGVPFWAKPPLSTWLTAGSFAAFGVNEFAARLPHFLVGLFVLWLTWDWLRARAPREALLAAALLSGAGVFYVSAGAVMTDMTLCLGVALAMRGFWFGANGPTAQRPINHAVMLAGLSMGLLAKGPIALVLTALPIVTWCALTGNFRVLWRALPWAVASALLAMPWYLLAELRTPGFLDYFLVGEHWKRFTTPGWTGDRYGSAHAYPRGSIWLFALIACLPWTLLLPWLVIGRPRSETPSPTPDRSWRIYLLAWSLAPLAFFTLSGNVLSTYVLPSLPALALLAAGWLVADARVGRVDRLLTIGLLMMAACVCAVAIAQHLSGGWKSARGIVERHESLSQGGGALLFLNVRPYSAAFYSRGTAEELIGVGALVDRVDRGGVWLALRKDQQNELPNSLTSRLTSAGRFGDYELYRVSQ